MDKIFAYLSDYINFSENIANDNIILFVNICCVGKSTFMPFNRKLKIDNYKRFQIRNAKFL